MHPDLRTFLDLLYRENEILNIEAEVDPYLEAAEIHRRVIERGGPALLFKRVKGSRYPVVTNLFGTARRIELAFGPKPENLVRELVQVAESLLPPRPAELWQHRSLAFEMLDRKLFERMDYRSILGIASPRLGQFDRTSGILKPDGKSALVAGTQV